MHVCRALRAAGADKDVRNARGLAAWQLAQANKQHAVERLFNPTLSDGEFTDVACASERLRAAAKGDVAVLQRSRDEGTITALKKEIEKAWKMVDTAQSKETSAKETITSLKEEIANLSNVGLRNSK